MFSRVEDFRTAWAAESATTLGVLRSLRADSLTFRVEGTRSVAELAWHIPVAVGDISRLIDLSLDAPPHGSEPPGDPELIADAYDRAARSLVEVTRSWRDSDLGVVDSVYGEEWSRGKTLFVLLGHEIHHRGQLVMLVRAGGGEMPRVYG